MAKFLETLQQKLSYAGAYTNHNLLQLIPYTLQGLHKNIEIHNIFDTHVMTLSLSVANRRIPMATLRLQFLIFINSQPSAGQR